MNCNCSVEMLVAGSFWIAARDRRFGIFVFGLGNDRKENTKAAIPRRNPKWVSTEETCSRGPYPLYSGARGDLGKRLLL